MRRWIYIVGLVIPFLATSQIASNKGRFTIEFDRGCPPFTVNISALEDFNEVTTLYSFVDSIGFINDTTFTYLNSGAYSIVQLVAKDSLNGELLTDKQDTLTIEVVEPQKPEIEIAQCSNSQIEVTSIDSFYDAIRVYFSPFDSVTLTTNQSSNYTFNSITTQTIRLKGLFTDANEVCQEYEEEIIPLSSIPTPELRSASIKQTCRDRYSLYISLDTVLAEVIYRITLEQNGSTLLYDDFLDTTDLVINDIPFTNADYCASLQTFNPCNNMTQSGNQICATPSELSLSPFESLYSSYEGSGIYINLDQVNSGSFEVSRSFNGVTFESRNTIDGSFRDPISSSSRQYFYQIDYRDECGEILYSAETNPPLVEADELNDNRYEIQFIAATNSLDIPDQTTYSIGSDGLQTSEPINSGSFTLNLNPENGASTQQLSASSSYTSGITVNSNTLSLRYEFVVYVPSAFTPNGDGMNDLLEFFGVPSENATVKIYSRWGQTIYSSNDLTIGWDGKVAGRRAQAGTYFYEILFETNTGDILRQRGNFVLLEN